MLMGPAGRGPAVAAPDSLWHERDHRNLESPGSHRPVLASGEGGRPAVHGGSDPARPGRFLGGWRHNGADHAGDGEAEGILDEVGVGFDRVVKTTCFLTTMDDFAAFNEVYGRYMSEGLPARSTVAVAGLPKGAAFEVDAVMVLD